MPFPHKIVFCVPIFYHKHTSDGISLKRIPLGSKKLSVLTNCPLYRELIIYNCIIALPLLSVVRFMLLEGFRYIYIHTATTIPQGSITIIYLYPWSHLYNTTQHLTDTLTFKDHWPHDLHDLLERDSQIPRTIGKRVTDTQVHAKEVHRYPGPLERGQLIPGPLERGSQIPGPLERGSQIPGPLERGSQIPGPLERGSQIPGPLERGSQIPRIIGKGFTDTQDRWKEVN